MAEAKAGALLGGVAALGAHAAGADARTTGAFRAFGERLGLAAQICDDVLQLWDRDARQKGGGRVLNKSKLFPVVHALEAGSIPQKRALGEVYFKRVMEPGDLAAVRAVLDEVGARGYAEDRARGFAAEALALLGSAGMSDVAMGRWGEIVGALVPV